MGPGLIEIAQTGWTVAAAGVSYDRYYYLGLFLLVVVLIYAIVKARGVWAEIHEEIDPEDPAVMLRDFEEAHAAGAIDDAEMARVKARLAAGPPGVSARPLDQSEPS